jgi:hypothetical protein
MRVEGYLFLCCALFFGGADVVYWNLSGDPTGTTALALSVALAFLTGFYLLFTGRRLPRRPEDDLSGEIEQGTGELGFFSPQAAAAVLGMSAALAAVGFAVGRVGSCSARFIMLSATGLSRSSTTAGSTRTERESADGRLGGPVLMTRAMRRGSPT